MSAPVHVYKAYIKADLAEVWRAITDGDLTAQYRGPCHPDLGMAEYGTGVRSDWKPGSSVQHVTRDGSVVADEISRKSVNTGYDANDGQYVNMVKAGIIDPTKVVKTALSNAASIAGLMLTTEALVTNFDPKEDDKRGVVGSIR